MATHDARLVAALTVVAVGRRTCAASLVTTGQAAVDTEHHLIVAHDVTSIDADRTLLSPMASRAKGEMAVDKIDVLADRGYCNGEEILARESISATPMYPNH